MNNKKILILGAGNAQIDLINYCNSIGMETYGCSYTNTDKGIPLLQHFAQINITDAAEVEKYFTDHQIDYIYSVGSDIAVPTICKVAEKTDTFHFVMHETAEICCNKHLMRTVLGDSEFNLPYILCDSYEELDQQVIFPAMIKPVDSQGQRGVHCVQNKEELKNCFEQAIAFSRCGKVIIEKYISGDEISVNAYMRDGKLIFCMISDRESFEHFPGGIIKAHHLPSVYENTQTADKVKQLVIETTKKLEIYDGPVYFQIKIAEEHPYLLEVTPRLDGCHMWKLIEKYCGINLLDLTMKHFLGKKVEVNEYQAGTGQMHLEFFCESPETIFDETKYDDYVSDEKVLYYQSGERVRRLNGYMEKCGYRIYRSLQKIGVIGGSGFIGKHFINLYGSRLEITDISRKNGAVTEYSVEQLEAALKGCDSVLILAAKKVNLREEQSAELYEDNLSIVRNSLEACRKLGIKNIVFTSTRCVYDMNQKMPAAEHAILHPMNDYGASKLAGEQICEEYHKNYGMNIKILRLAQVFGESDTESMAGIFLKNALSGVELKIYGNAAGRRDYIYVKDVCRALMISLTKYHKHGVYNIGSGKAVNSKEFAEAVIRGIGSSSQCVECKEQKEDPSIFWLNVEKARDELGFTCQYSLEDAFLDLKYLLDAGDDKVESTI